MLEHIVAGSFVQFEGDAAEVTFHCTARVADAIRPSKGILDPLLLLKNDALHFRIFNRQDHALRQLDLILGKLPPKLGGKASHQ